MLVRQGEIEVGGKGKLALAWLPGPDTRFDLAVEGREAQLAVFREEITVGPAVLVLPGVTTVPCHVLLAGHEVHDGIGSARVEGHTDWVEIGDPGVPLDSLTFHLVNSTPFGGTGVTRIDDDGRSSWGGRLEADLFPWVLTLDSVSHSSALQKEVKARGGFAITHVGRIRRADDAEFLPVEADGVLSSIFHVVSFARGGWAPPSLLVGQGRDGEVVWRRLGIWKCHPFKPKFTWFPRDDARALAAVLEAAWSRSDDGRERAAFSIACNFYVEATHAESTETALLLSQAGIECLASVRGVGGSKAAPRIRRMLERAGLPLGLPRSLPRLAAYATARHIPDGPAAMVSVRNAIGHTKDPRVFLDGGWPSTEAARLGNWYLEMLLLHDLGYAGAFEDQLDLDGWVRSTPVPWRGRTPEPPGDLPQNGGNSQS